ncbi:MAG: DUF1569 domain-containing protein [Planctomycetota bacterium]
MSSTPEPSRRTLSFHTMSDIANEVDALDQSGVETIGGWSPAQNLEHVTRAMDFSLDGFDFKAPIPLRYIAPLMKNKFLKGGFNPGIKLTGDFAKAFTPPDDITWDDAIMHFNRTIDRLYRGERMVQRSPLFGSMTHEDWVRLHCRHCELHFSHLHPTASA